MGTQLSSTERFGRYILRFCGYIALAVVSTLGMLRYRGAWLLAMPITVAYIAIYLGLTALPDRMMLKQDLSYEIYLIHAPVIITVLSFWPSLHTWWIAVIVVTLATLVFAYLSWTFV